MVCLAAPGASKRSLAPPRRRHLKAQPKSHAGQGKGTRTDRVSLERSRLARDDGVTAPGTWRMRLPGTTHPESGATASGVPDLALSHWRFGCPLRIRAVEWRFRCRQAPALKSRGGGVALPKEVRSGIAAPAWLALYLALQLPTSSRAVSPRAATPRGRRHAPGAMSAPEGANKRRNRKRNANPTTASVVYPCVRRACSSAGRAHRPPAYLWS